MSAVRPTPETSARPALQIVDPGPLTTVQDLGRPGLAHIGVGRSGACDEPAIRVANRVVGNPESAAALEFTLGGVVARLSHATWVALTGASATVSIDGAQQSFFSPLFVAAGAEIRVGTPERGVRSYLALRGGLAVPPVLGSRSTDLLTGIGPPVVKRGDVLFLGDEVAGAVAGVDLVPTRPMDLEPLLGVVGGPRPEWFPANALKTLVGATWEVSPDSNRIGVRLIGPAIGRSVLEELPSEGLVDGAIQIPPSGQPVLFLADHPVTGGYPVLAVLQHSSLAVAAQLRSGQHLRFTLGRA